MKSAVLVAGASLLLFGVEGALAASNSQAPAARDATPTGVAGDFDGEGTLPLNDLHHHHHHHDNGCHEGHHHHGHHHHGHHHGHHHHHHGHHHHHHEEKPACGIPTVTKNVKECFTTRMPACTVTKTCTAVSKCMVTDTCTVKVPEPTTVIKEKKCTVTSYLDPVTITKSKVCTTTVVKAKTLTKCIDHTKTQTEWFPKYTTKTATATVIVDPPKCTPAPKTPCCLATQQQHVVEEGDDYSEIAALYNTTISNLFQDNSFLTEDFQLALGDILCVPSVDSGDLMEKRDTAHHHHHHHDVSCEEEPEHPSCEPPKKKHHHHNHGHKHHHHKHHHHHHKHHKHHKHHGHHHHKPTKTKTEIEVVTPTPDKDCDDSPIHCGLCHAWHNVWPGDCTSSIAKRYGISEGEILHLNPWIGNGNKLQEGGWVCVSGCDIPIKFDPVSDEDDDDECAPEHICVPCARPGVCAQGGKHAACPENYSCEKKP